MSSIFGYFLKKHINGPVFEGLSFWNSSYGGEESGTADLGCAGLGGFTDHLHRELPKDPAVLRSGKNTAVFDALLFNRSELSTLLSDPSLLQMSDERLLLEVWLQKGTDGLKAANGDFTGAVFDGETLTVFRDHLGVRPLFLYEDDRITAFSTDLRGLLAIPGADRSLNDTALYASFAHLLTDTSETTLFRRIRRLKPGCICRITERGAGTPVPYFSLPEEKLLLPSEDEYAEQLHSLVSDAIRCRLAITPQQPVAAEFSGGLDSSVINVLLKKSGADLHSFSWSPSPQIRPLVPGDERLIIEKTCEKYGMTCEYADLTVLPSEVFNSRTLPPEIDQGMLELTLDFASRSGCRTVFTGWGGDEGISHRAGSRELLIRGETAAYLHELWFGSRGPLQPLRFLKHTAEGLADAARCTRVVQTSPVLADPPFCILDPEWVLETERKVQRIPYYFRFDPQKTVENGYNARRTENAAVFGALHGVRYLFPYLDHRVESFAFSIPRSLYLKDGLNRCLYRKAFLEEMVPELQSYTLKSDPGGGILITTERLCRFQELQRSYFEELDQELWSDFLSFEKLTEIMKNCAASGTSLPGSITAVIYTCAMLQRLIRL